MLRLVYWILSLSFLLLLTQCGGINSVYFDNRQCISGTVPSSSGYQIYKAGCSVIGCHAPKGDISIAGKSANDIRNALLVQPAMQSLSCLGSEEIEKLGEYLSSLRARDGFGFEDSD